MVLVGHQHLTVRNFGKAAHLKQKEQALGGMTLERGPLILRQSASLVYDFGVHAHLADIMEQCAETQLV